MPNTSQATFRTPLHAAFKKALQVFDKMRLDHFELYLFEKKSTQIDSKNLQTDSLTTAQDVGLSIRVLNDHRLGFSYTTSLENDAVDHAIQNAYAISKSMSQDEFSNLYLFKKTNYPQLNLEDKDGLRVPLESKIKMAQELESQCKKADPRVKGVRSASVTENFYHIQMLDSEHTLIEYSKTLFSAHVTCMAEENGDSQIGSDMGFSYFLNKLDIPKIGSQAAKYATELLGAKQTLSLKCEAVFRNQVVAELIEFLSASLSAEEIDKGRSLLKGLAGKKVFSDQITLIDDGILAGGYSSSPFDDEGVPCTSKELVAKGILGEPLNNLYYAQKNSSLTTGNASRGIKTPPRIHLSNLYLCPGQKELHEICKSIQKGVLITDLMGLHTANPITGDFSLGASGFLIENGNLTTALRGFAVAGNILEILKEVQEVGNDLKFFGNVGAPSLHCKEVSIGGN